MKNMSEQVKKEKYFLLFLINASENQQKLLMSNLTKNQIKVIIEVAYNALMGTLVLDENDKRKLKRYRHVIRKLVSKEITVKKRRALLSKYYKQIILLIKPCQLWLKN